jgi:hypothetical protein
VWIIELAQLEADWGMLLLVTVPAMPFVLRLDDTQAETRDVHQEPTSHMIDALV